MKQVTSLALIFMIGATAFGGGGNSGNGSSAGGGPGGLGGVNNGTNLQQPIIGASVSGYEIKTAAQVGNVSSLTFRGQNNEQLFSQFCMGSASGASAVAPNYSNQLVRSSAKILSRVATIGKKAIIEYGAIARMYSSPVPAPIDGVEIKKEAHGFLSQLCGEFRDRASMIEEKLNWVQNTILLPDENASQMSFDMNGNPWRSLSTQGYKRYIQITDQVWSSKQQIKGIGSFAIGNASGQAQRAIDGFTVCETKYIISELVLRNKGFSASSYFSGYEGFRSRCSSDDLNYYYDFRGDSNLKAQSPESNAMIWHSISVAKQCNSMTGSKGRISAQGLKFENEDCANYYSKPFESRFKAARSGLASWLMRTDSHGQIDDAYKSPKISGWIHPLFNFNLLSTHPFPYSKGSLTTEPLFFNLRMDLPDFGMNDLFANDKGTMYKRLRDAVDRHTNWYESGYNDGFATSAADSNGHYREQAYSPFVASSYEMSKSDAFTAPGYTVNVEGDGQKQWMFVFKVRKDNWYRADDLAAGKRIDFDRMWIDETSFGIEPLADAERAWNRLGTAMEGELDSLLFLHNMNSSGVTTKNDQL